MVHWKYIKGMDQVSNNNTPTSYYTFIRFGNSAGAMPHIYLNNLEATNDKGAILTTNNPNQSLKGNLNLTEGNFSVTGTGAFIHKIDSTHDVEMLKYDSSKTRVALGTSSVDTEIKKSLYVASYLCVGGITGTDTGCVYGLSSSFTGKCSAGYFVTTSDRRAKKNIENCDFDALALVLKTPVYSFTYKDTETPSIGIIAQDVQDVNIKGFDLVDNKGASGVDFDYMHIHEGKLVYVLWKAIQEQQKEIEELKKQLQK